MSFLKRSLQSFALSSLITGALAGLDASGATNIAVYWGQNSYGSSSGDLEQQNLAYYCENSDIDILPMAFMYQFNGQGGEPVINFANSGNACSTFPGTELLDCPQIAQDIVTCQNTYDKTILLSVGGATYSEGGWSTAAEAQQAAQMLWGTFGPTNYNASALRPFGKSVVDGFDFDFETGVTNALAFAQELRSLMSANTAQTGKKWFLTAAPQCPFPDYADNPMLSGGIEFDAVFVQFYNNYCGLQSYENGEKTQNNFDFSTWDNWAKQTSANPDVRVLLGVPADTSAAGSGYESGQTLQEIITYCKQFSSFGGVMMWDASQAYANNGFVAAVASDLGKASARLKRVMKRWGYKGAQ